MDSDNKFWLLVTLIITVGIVAAFSAILTYQNHKNELKVDMVRAGASPAEASCSLDGTTLEYFVTTSENRR